MSGGYNPNLPINPNPGPDGQSGCLLMALGIMLMALVTALQRRALYVPEVRNDAHPRADLCLVFPPADCEPFASLGA